VLWRVRFLGYGHVGSLDNLHARCGRVSKRLLFLEMAARRARNGAVKGVIPGGRKKKSHQERKE